MESPYADQLPEDGASPSPEELKVMVEEKARELFAVCDVEEKGFVNKLDMRRLVGELPGHDETQLEFVFDSLDKDGNGFLTLEEFTQGFGGFLGVNSTTEEPPEHPGLYEADQETDNLDAAFEQAMTNLGAEGILSEQEQIKGLWTKLRQENPDLLGNFEDVLQKVSVDIRSATNSRGELEQILKSRSDIHEQEVSKLYEEMEQQIKGEKDKLIAQEKERERREREEMDDEMRRKEELLNELLQKQAELEAKLTELAITEKQTKEEKEMLEETNSELFGQLQYAEKDLEQTKSYLKTLQDKVKEEKRARADASLRVTRGIAEERASLCKQLNLLRDMNKKLLDERDAYTMKEEDVNEEFVDRNPMVKQGSIMSDYFDPGDGHSNGHADINANSLPEDEEDVEYDYEYEYSTGILPTQNNHQDHEYVLNNSHHSTYTTNGRLLPRDNIIDETDSGFMAVRSSTLNHNSTPLSEELAQSLHSEFEEISATEVDNQFSAPPSQLRQGGRAHRHWSTSTKRAELNSSTETASIEDAPRGPGEGEESPLEEVRLSPKLHRPKKLESETIIEEGSQETNLLKDPQRLYKVVFVGDSYVGKTSLMHRVCNDAFHDGFNATIGVDFQVKTMSVKGNSVAIQLWDTAGQERFRSITRHYFRKSDAVIVVYDVTSEKSFLSVRNWMTSIEEVTDEHVVRVIIGNKVDLEDLRQVQKKRGEEIAGTYQSLFYEASAKSGVNVADCVEELAHNLLEKEDREMEEALKLINEVVAKKKCCRS